MPKKKKRVGIFSLSCDEGCTVYMLELFNKKLIKWLEKIEIIYFLSIKDKVKIENLDIALIEGMVNTKKEKKEVKEIRKNSKVLIALGSCAIAALPSGQRNNFNKEQLEEIDDILKSYDYLPKCLSVKEVVKVDDEVPGCPISGDKFIKVFEKYI